MVQARHGAVLDRKGQDGLRIKSQSDGQRSPDRATKCDRDDIAAPELLCEVLHSRLDARAHVSKALAPRRALVCGCVPVARRRRGPVGSKTGAVEALPLAQMLFGKRRNRTKGRGGLVLV